MQNFEEKLNDEWKKYQKQESNAVLPNIMLLGASGSGKSSLINKIFGREIAPVSDLRPQTRENHIYRGKDYGLSVNLIDSAGYELGQADAYYNRIHELIEKGIPDGPIHIVWYCSAVSNERVQDMDIDILQKLANEPSIRQRICVVFTKCDNDEPGSPKANALKRAFDKNLGISLRYFETSNADGCELEIPNLIQWSADSINDEDLRRKFISAQFSDLDFKHTEAAQIIKTAMTAAGIIGAVPIPFSDAALLIPTQVAMMGKIIDIYGISSLANISKAVVTDLIMANIGRGLAAGILKLIPIAGSIVGGVINAGVASALTGAIGHVTSELCYTNLKLYLEGKPVKWDEIFANNEFVISVTETFKEYKEKLSKKK